MRVRHGHGPKAWALSCQRARSATYPSMRDTASGSSMTPTLPTRDRGSGSCGGILDGQTTFQTGCATGREVETAHHFGVVVGLLAARPRLDGLIDKQERPIGPMSTPTPKSWIVTPKTGSAAGHMLVWLGTTVRLTANQAHARNGSGDDFEI